MNFLITTWKGFRFAAIVLFCAALCCAPAVLLGLDLLLWHWHTTAVFAVAAIWMAVYGCYLIGRGMEQ
jgi:hypothetical protein